MKRFYTFLMVALSAGAMNAQRVGTINDFAASKQYASPSEVHASAQNGQNSVEMAAIRGGGSEFFYEDFANGFDGNNGVGAWTFEDTGGNTIWMMADEDSPAGQWSGGIGALNSETNDNGWVIFDCDLYNTPDGGETVVGSLYSPSMDMTDLSTVVVEWNQYFRYCCFGISPLTVDVSIDGGTTWESWPAHGNFIEDANTLSANPLVTSVDISCLAAGESDVQIRWSYNIEGFTGYSHYFWGIDDVRIYENPTMNDIEVTQVTNGDIWNDWEYRVTPMEQALSTDDGGLLVGTIYKNIGSENLDSSQVTIEVLDDADAVIHTFTSEYFTIPSSANAPECPQFTLDSVYYNIGWAPEEAGKYTVRSTITSNVEYDTPGMNSADRVIEYSDDEYGHDDDDVEDALDIELRPRDSDIEGLFGPTGYGSFFTFPYDVSTAYGVTVRFGRFSDAGCEFEVRLYEMEPGTSINEADYVTSSDWTLADEWIPNNVSQSTPVYFEFDDPWLIDASLIYFACVVNDFDSEQELTVFGNADSDTDFSTRRIDQSGDGDWIWFADTSHPAVRLILSQRVGVDELAALNGVEAIECYPNPANNNARIAYTLESAKDIRIEIRDLSGRLVRSADQGVQPAGEHTYELNVSELSSGMYTYTIIADSVQLTKKLTVRH